MVRANIRSDSTLPKPTVMARSRSPSAVRERVSIVPVNEWTFKKTRPMGKLPASVEIRHDGKVIEAVLKNVVSPFEPSSFIEPCNRKTLTLRLPEEWDDALACLEACLIHEVIQRASVLFEDTFTSEQITEMYCPITKKDGDFPRDFRAKINTNGTSGVRYWDVNKTRMTAPPESHANACWSARVIFHALWISKDKWGLVADVTDLIQLGVEVVDCPF
jgi:hypothetical protein